MEKNRPDMRISNVVDTKQTRTTPGPVPELIPAATSSGLTNKSKSHIYQYGIKNINLLNSLYKQEGVFVTKPIEVEGNIVEVSLETVEDHPLFDEIGGMATERLTSIEYYVALEENPSLSDWIPILPEHVDIIKCEKLFFQGQTAKLRFHADINKPENTRVYKNNILMKPDDWYFTERGAAVQLVKSYDTNAIYTIDYVPDSALSNPWSVKINPSQAREVRHIDVFPNGTDYNNTIKLSKYPFIDYEYINNKEAYDPNSDSYRPFDVILKDSTITDGEGGIQESFFPKAYSDGNFTTINRTDYKNKRDPELRKYSIAPGKEYKNIEYKQEKNKLIFTESFNRSDSYYNESSNHGNAKIEVHYDYLVMNFRLKIILRKNTGDDLVVTPMVNSYQLKFKVMK